MLKNVNAEFWGRIITGFQHFSIFLDDGRDSFQIREF